jgi:hypothetical protein
VNSEFGENSTPAGHPAQGTPIDESRDSVSYEPWNGSVWVKRKDHKRKLLGVLPTNLSPEVALKTINEKFGVNFTPDDQRKGLYPDIPAILEQMKDAIQELEDRGLIESSLDPDGRCRLEVPDRVKAMIDRGELNDTNVLEPGILDKLGYPRD